MALKSHYKMTLFFLFHKVYSICERKLGLSNCQNISSLVLGLILVPYLIIITDLFFVIIWNRITNILVAFIILGNMAYFLFYFYFSYRKRYVLINSEVENYSANEVRRSKQIAGTFILFTAVLVLFLLVTHFL